MDMEIVLQVLQKQALALVDRLKEWSFGGEGDRQQLHDLGDEIQRIADGLAVIRRDIQFPSFAAPVESASPEQRRKMAARRRDLVILATTLSPSNTEILECLGDRDDKEAAYLYAYSRGSVSAGLGRTTSAFYKKLDGIIQDDPVLSDVRGVENLLGIARRSFSRGQAEAYENMS